MSAALAHSLLVAVVIAAYTVLTVTGHDGNLVLAFLGGQAAGGVVQAKARSGGG